MSQLDSLYAPETGISGVPMRRKPTPPTPPPVDPIAEAVKIVANMLVASQEKLAYTLADAIVVPKRKPAVAFSVSYERPGPSMQMTGALIKQGDREWQVVFTRYADGSTKSFDVIPNQGAF